MKFAPLFAAMTLIVLATGASADDLDKVIPSPALDPVNSGPADTVVLAGGCFWGQQGLFEHVKGVTKVVAGYSGGSRATAHYEDVGTETTGHAESVQITFDPRQISFGTLLRIYFSVAHDPTELNYQGPDEGTSYRSEIFFTSPDQEKIARAYIAQLDGAHVFAHPIVTRVEKMPGFYNAEDYHQDFLAHHPTQDYIAAVDMPKLAALKRVWPQYYSAAPMLLARR
jgi:peptide-methionine (S)-S-oxide reductase